MTKFAQLLIAGLIAATFILAAALPAFADEEGEKKLGWSSTAEVSFVLTSGNSESTTLGFNSTTERQWAKALLQMKLGALKVKTTTDLGVAIGDPSSFSIPEITQTTAENYFIAGKYDRNITDRLFWYVAAGWLRNEFAGIEDRYVVSGGLGNVWFDSKTFSFRTNYGFSYTDQQDIVEIPLIKSQFGG